MLVIWLSWQNSATFKMHSYTKCIIPLDGYNFALRTQWKLSIWLFLHLLLNRNIRLQCWFHFFTFKCEVFYAVAEDRWLIRFNCALWLLRHMNWQKTRCFLALHAGQSFQHSNTEIAHGPLVEVCFKQSQTNSFYKINAHEKDYTLISTMQDRV